MKTRSNVKKYRVIGAICKEFFYKKIFSRWRARVFFIAVSAKKFSLRFAARFLDEKNKKTFLKKFLHARERKRSSAADEKNIFRFPLAKVALRRASDTFVLRRAFFQACAARVLRTRGELFL
jgi:hypothetical protein